MNRKLKQGHLSQRRRERYSNRSFHERTFGKTSFGARKALWSAEASRNDANVIVDLESKYGCLIGRLVGRLKDFGMRAILLNSAADRDFIAGDLITSSMIMGHDTMRPGLARSTFGFFVERQGAQLTLCSLDTYMRFTAHP